MARALILLLVLVALVALVLYAIVWLYQTHLRTDLEETKLEHERRMAREDRDYDALIQDIEREDREDDR